MKKNSVNIKGERKMEDLTTHSNSSLKNAVKSIINRFKRQMINQEDHNCIHKS